MKIRIASDIHTEFWGSGNPEKIKRMINTYALPPLEDDKKTLLILAGDIGSMHKPENIFTALEVLSDRFDGVAYIPGNHEIYGGDMRDYDYIAKELSHLKNVMFGECLQVGYGSKEIHMCTLWTDFDGQNEHTMREAQYGMNDYRICGGREGQVLTPQDTLQTHLAHVQDLRESVKEGDIVVTHHLPSFKSIDGRYTRSTLNGAYATNLEALIDELKPSLWIHGHTHCSKDYMLGNTRIVCNPRGYEGHEVNPDYKKDLVIEV